jgi:hypothetical protein
MANTIDFNVDSNAMTVLNQTATAADGAAKGIKTLKAQYAELKKQQDQFDPGTEKFNQLSQKMGELKDRMNDAADAVKGNTGPAIEGMSNSFGLMGQQLGNLDFEGLTQSINLFSGNLSRIDVKALSGGLKAMLAAGVQGFKVLGNVIKQNPIFLLVGAIVGIIAYWKELSDLVSGKKGMLESLNKQADALKSQEQSLTRQLALQKALGEGAAAILRTELDMLANKQRQAEVAMEIAVLEDDKVKFLEAQQQQLTAINDVEMRRIKIHKDAQSLLDKIRAGKDDEYNKQLLQNQAFSEYKARTEELGVEQQRNNERARQVNNEIADAQRRGNDELVKKLQLEKQSLYNQNVSIQSNKDEIWNAGMAAKEEVKTEKELARIAAAKAKQAERKSAADAAAKKLADEILTIEQRIIEIQRSTLPEQEREVLLLKEKQAEELKTYEKGKKNAEDLAKLKTAHATELKVLTDKYNKEAQEKEAEKLAKEKEIAEETKKQKEKELADLQAIIDAADKANIESENTQQERDLIASQEYYLTLKEQAKAAGLDTAALIEEQGRKENEIKEKYRKEDEAKQQATQDFRLKQLGESFAALGALNDAFTKKGQQQSKKQFQIQKALNLASAVVDTYGGINRALNDKTMPSTTARIIQASIVGAMGLANVIKISKTEYGNASAPSGTSPSAGGGGDGGTTAPSPANFAFLQNQPNQQPPLQAYVVGTQVSSNLEAQQLIQNQSRLGG